nr:hypothetical protein [Prevotella sp.]
MRTARRKLLTTEVSMWIPYINTGGKIIDLGNYDTKDMNIELDFKAFDKFGYLFGWNEGPYAQTWAKNIKNKFQFSTQTPRPTSNISLVNEEKTLKFKLSYIYNGNVDTAYISYNEQHVQYSNIRSSSGNLYLGGISGIEPKTLDYTIYGFRMYNKKGELLLNLKPFRKSENVIGLKDTITGRFYELKAI